MVYQNGNAIAMSVIPAGGVTMDQVEAAIDEKIAGIRAEEVYSTEETRIGTWIDGKSLYRKVITGKTGTIGARPTFKISSSSITCVNAAFFIKDSDGNDVMFPAIDAESKVMLGSFYIHSNLGLLVKVSKESLVNRPFSAILEYTKTTDQATTLSGQNSISFNLDNQAMPTSAATVSIASTESVEFENVEDV